MDISEIETSLTYGGILSRRVLKIFKIFLIIPSLSPAVTFLVIIIILRGAMDWHPDMMFGLVTVNLLSMCLLGLLSYAIIHSNRLNKKIVLWLEDAIETTAFVRRMDIVGLEFKPNQVQVEFKINGKEYYRLSAPGGITGVFIKYANKRINILYSPKYNEVLILKNKNTKQTNIH